jgi:hypothetical protein
MKSNQISEVGDVNNSTDYFGASACGCIAGLAVQPGLGLLPQRWTRTGGRSAARTAFGRTIIKRRFFSLREGDAINFAPFSLCFLSENFLRFCTAVGATGPERGKIRKARGSGRDDFKRAVRSQKKSGFSH